ncbi:RidA family protein [Frigidibacter sp. MR17.14]|uniref:RidA family protein n=1 Tax=Frigidibacter sp. MR17.14 TaxID=3126509 RepID=UPI003012FBD8
MTKITKLKSGSLYEEKLSYSRAVVIGDWILVANTAGRNYKTRYMSTDPVEQTQQLFANVEGALAAVGASLKDVVRQRISIPYLEHKEAVMGVVAEKFKGIDPVNTITACPLAAPDYLVEIEVTAYRGAGETETEYLRISLGA